MPFTATVQSIQLQGDQFQVVIRFEDSTTGHSSSKTYMFPEAVTLSEVNNAITTDGQRLKSNLTRLNQIQGRVGTVITI